jgi:hypothetical protein
MSIQSNFEKLFSARKLEAIEHSGHTPEIPPNQGIQSAQYVNHQHAIGKAGGTCTLNCMQGKI